MGTTETIARDGRANLVGSLWMVAAMAIFAGEDAMVKAASAHLPIAEVLVLFGLGGAIVFAIAATARREPLFGPAILSRAMRIRACFEVTARLFYVLALALTPLSATTVILQATPIVVVLGAAVLFREHVGWQRWLAILVGLAGVLIVLRPGAESFSALSILALIGMLGFAGRDLASRAAPRSVTTSVLGVYGFAAIVVAGVLYALLWERQAFIVPGAAAMAFLSTAVACGVLAYAALMKAMRTGAVSVVTPFRYTRLLFGIALGVLVFGERLDLPTLAGSLVIVLAGIIIMKRPSRLSLFRASRKPS
ncbi:MAG: DMT family transporter [Mesorhizobium sp.]